MNACFSGLRDAAAVKHHYKSYCCRKPSLINGSHIESMYILLMQQVNILMHERLSLAMHMQLKQYILMKLGSNVH